MTGHSVAITIPTKWAGRSVPDCQASLRAACGRMVVFSHSSNGLNHFRDRATGVGVMPFRELAFEL